MLIIGLLWWAWTGYAWLANVASADEPEIKLALLVSMSAMFVLALTIPEAFDDAAGRIGRADRARACAICWSGSATSASS